MLLKNKLGRKLIKKAQKRQYRTPTAQVTGNEEGETALPTHNLLQLSSSHGGKPSSLQVDYAFSKTQNVEKALLMYKNLSNPYAKRVKHFVDGSNLPVAKSYTNNSYPNTNIATSFKFTAKQTSATIRRSLR